MRTMMALLATASLALAQEGTTKEDVAKLAKAGVGDDVIIAKLEQDKAVFALSADDLLALKGAGVSDRVLQAMLGRGAPRPAPAAPQAGGEGNLVLRNTSHRVIRAVVNERDGIVNFTTKEGTELARGGRVEFTVTPGEYRIAVEGAPTRHVVKLPATLWVRGAEMEYLDVMTLTIEDPAGTTIMILDHAGKEVEGNRPHPSVRHSMRGLYGPQFSYIPFVSNNVLLGAGVGAIIGHQSGHRTHGALIGAAAGALLDFYLWRP